MRLISLDNLDRFWTNLKDRFVERAAGKDLSTNDLTDALKAYYDAAYTHSQSAHAPSGAEANVLESVRVNGAALSISGKAVDVPVPTAVSTLTNDAGYQTEAQVDAKIAAIDVDVDLTGYLKATDIVEITAAEIDALFD